MSNARLGMALLAVILPASLTTRDVSLAWRQPQKKGRREDYDGPCYFRR